MSDHSHHLRPSTEPALSQGKGRRMTLFIPPALILGMCVLAISIRVADTASAAKTYPVLGACSGSLLAFPVDPNFSFGDPVKNARDTYHKKISDVVEAHLGDRNVQCSDGVKDAPTQALQDIARLLPPWKDSEDLAELRETDIGAVLLEYLRVYECHLKENEYFASIRIPTKDDVLNVPAFFGTFIERLSIVNFERAFARKALHRTLSILGGFDRLRPLDASLECLQRSSLDIRNSLGLAADTTSCLPRIWDARGSLRDIPDDDTP